jgi:putative hemolysin
MNETIVVEILLLLCLILINGVLAATEIAVVSSRPSRLEHMARSKVRGAARALQLALGPDRFLSTIQVGITGIGILAGAFGGATLAGKIDSWLETIPLLARYSEVLGVLIVVSLITYASLVFGELVPKRIALNSPERIASALATPMHLLSRLAAPLVMILAGSTAAILRVLGVGPKVEAGVTSDELRLLVRHGLQAGSIDADERLVFERALQFRTRPVRSVMTPRVEVDWIDLARPIEELREQVLRTTHSYFPAGEGRIDDLIGVLRGRDVFSTALDATPLRSLVREPLIVPSNLPVQKLVHLFREQRTHLAIVVDEYSSIDGIVTATDVLNALVGELPTEEEEPAAFLRADGSWSLDAGLDIEEVKLLLGIDELEGQKLAYQSIAGYIIAGLGDLPHLGDIVEASGWRFEIIDMDGRRIDRILVTRIVGPEGSA